VTGKDLARVSALLDEVRSKVDLAQRAEVFSENNFPSGPVMVTRRTPADLCTMESRRLYGKLDLRGLVYVFSHCTAEASPNFAFIKSIHRSHRSSPP
jgi:hypothetical protein